MYIGLIASDGLTDSRRCLYTMIDRYVHSMARARPKSKAWSSFPANVSIVFQTCVKVNVRWKAKERIFNEVVLCSLLDLLLLQEGDVEETEALDVWLQLKQRQQFQDDRMTGWHRMMEMKINEICFWVGLWHEAGFWKDAPRWLTSRCLSWTPGPASGETWEVGRFGSSTRVRYASILVQSQKGPQAWCGDDFGWLSSVILTSIQVDKSWRSMVEFPRPISASFVVDSAKSHRLWLHGFLLTSLCPP